MAQSCDEELEQLEAKLRKIGAAPLNKLYRIWEEPG
jgi:hypothetical protein